MNFECNVIREMGCGAARVHEQDYEWKVYLTDKQNVRVLCVRYPDERIYETYYDSNMEEFRKALDRLLPDFF